MGKIICSACYTEYPDEFTECPLCGHREESADTDASTPSAPHTDKPQPAPEEKKLPKALSVSLICLLAVIVLAAGSFIIYNIGFFWQPLSTMSVVRRFVPSFTSSAPAAQPPEETINPESYTNEEDQNGENESLPAQEEEIACTDISLGSTTITFEEAEQFYNMTVKLIPEDCTQPVSFVSLDPAIASVNDNGKIVAISGGSTDVVVTCGDVSERCLVTCDFSVAAGEEAPPMKLNNEDMTFFSLGEQFALAVENLPDGATVSFASSRPAVASVDEKGVVTAMGIGTANITATVGDATLTCIVRCNLENTAENATPEDPNCTISHSDVTMAVMGEYFKLFLKDSNNKPVSNVTWKTSNPGVCSVDVNGTVKATGRGTATVSTIYGGVTYQCIVRCNIG